MKLPSILLTSATFSILLWPTLYWQFGNLGTVIAAGVFLVAVDTLVRAKKSNFTFKEI